MPFLILLIALALQGPARTYDDVTDTTVVSLKPSMLVDESGNPTVMTLYVFGSFAGDDRPRDAMVSLGLISAARTWQFSGDTDRLELTLDGRLVKIGPLRHEWTTTADGSVFQQTWAEVTPQQLLDILRATSFRGRYGPLAFNLTPQQRDAMRALATELSSKD